MSKQSQSDPSIRNVHKMHGGLVHRLFHEPLAMSPESIPELLLALTDDKVGETMAKAFAPEPSASVSLSTQSQGYEVTSDRWGNPLPKPTASDGIAYIPISGTIVKGAGNLGRWYGMCDLNNLSQWIRTAVNDPEIKALVFVTDSPGGFTTGVTEIATMIQKCKKPTMAYTEGTMGSAAYWIGGSADYVYGTPSSNVGSIGAFIAIQDASKFFERMGVKLHVFRSGEYKGTGIDGITDKQAEYLQERVDANAKDFKQSVSNKRPLIDDKDMQGQSYFGAEAAPRGFLAGTVDGLEEAVTKFNSHTN